MTPGSLLGWHGLAWFDALGLAAYATYGAAKGLAYGVAPVLAFGMGVPYCLSRGIIRDLLAGAGRSPPTSADIWLPRRTAASDWPVSFCAVLEAYWSLRNAVVKRSHTAVAEKERLNPARVRPPRSLAKASLLSTTGFNPQLVPQRSQGQRQRACAPLLRGWWPRLRLRALTGRRGGWLSVATAPIVAPAAIKKPVVEPVRPVNDRNPVRFVQIEGVAESAYMWSSAETPALRSCS